MTNAIEVSDLVKTFGRTRALDGLHLSVATVKNHVHAVLSKLDLTRRAQVGELLRKKPWLLRSA